MEEYGLYLNDPEQDHEPFPYGILGTLFSLYMINMSIHLIRQAVIGDAQKRPKDFIWKWCAAFFGSIGVIILASIPLFLSMAFGGVLEYSLGPDYSQGFGSLLFFLFSIAGFPVFLFLFLRLTFYVTGKVCGHDVTLRGIWGLTRGYFWKILGVNAAYVLFAFLLILFYVAGYAMFLGLSVNPVLLFLLQLAGNLMSLFLAAFWAGTQGVMYRTMSAEKEPPKSA